jgi:ketosteroid isomerase-like protein
MTVPRDLNGFVQAIEQCRAALHGFVGGDHEPMRQLFSQREDVVLCNPWVPVAHGPTEVAETLEEAASHFADGDIKFQTVEQNSTGDLGYVIEIEEFTAKLDGKAGSGALRVTMILRLEDGVWRVAHRHADPITAPKSPESTWRR